MDDDDDDDEDDDDDDDDDADDDDDDDDGDDYDDDDDDGVHGRTPQGNCRGWPGRNHSQMCRPAETGAGYQLGIPGIAFKSIRHTSSTVWRTFPKIWLSGLSLAGVIDELEPSCKQWTSADIHWVSKSISQILI